MDELVRRLQKGDDAAFEEFVSTYEKKIYTLALRQIGNAQDAQDITQEVFLRVYRNIGSFRAESRLSTWVYQITMNACIDATRRRARRVEVTPMYTDEDGEEQTPIELPDESYAPEKMFEQTSLREQIKEGLEHLSEEHRRILVLRDINGLSYTEIAEVLNLSEGTVKSRLFRARDRMCTFLRAHGNIPCASASKEAERG